MNFKDEYKKSAESISPDREAIDRMKAAVMAKLAEEQGEFPEVPAEPAKLPEAAESEPHRKPLPLKRIAFIGGTVAACAVITVSAVTLLPNLRADSSLINEEAGTSSAAMAEDTAHSSTTGYQGNDEAVGDVQDDACEDADCAVDISDDDLNKGNQNPGNSDAQEEYPPESANEITVPTEGLDGYDGGLPESAIVAGDAELSTYEEYTGEPDRGNPLTGTGALEDEATENPCTGADEPIDEAVDNAGNPEIGAPDIDAAEDDISDKSTDVTDNGTEPDMGFDNSEEAVVTLESGYYTLEAELATEEVYEEEEVATEESKATLEDYISEEADEALVEEEPKLVLTKKGWLTYGGVRYDLDSSVTSAKFPAAAVPVQNVLDGAEYYVRLDGYVLKLFDGEKNFLGLYRKRV